MPDSHNKMELAHAVQLVPNRSTMGSSHHPIQNPETMTGVAALHRSSFSTCRSWLGTTLALGWSLFLFTSPTIFSPDETVSAGSRALGVAGGLVLPLFLAGLMRLRLRTFHGAMMIFGILAPGVVIYQQVTGLNLSPFALQIAFETNIQEVRAFGAQVNRGVLFMLLAALTLWFARRWLPAWRLDWKVSAAACVMAGLLAAYDARSPRPGWVMEQLPRRLTDRYPVSLVKAATGFAQHLLENDDPVGIKASTLPFAGTGSSRRVIVFVLGESSRSSAWSLYGYERNTTPRLAARDDILRFDNVATCGMATCIAVPLLFTSCPVPEFHEHRKFPSLPLVFKNAGYRVFWFSGVGKQGLVRTEPSYFSKFADEAKFLAGIQYKEGGKQLEVFDDQLIPHLKHVLAEEKGDVFIVLHTAGSHVPYYLRYPASFARWPADTAQYMHAHELIYSDPARLSKEDITAVNNAYDNTIAFTDDFLGKVIDVLSDAKTLSAMIYASDHGQTGPGSKKPFLHGFPDPEVVQVPMVAWFSPQYAERAPDKINAMKARLKSPVSVRSLFNTLPDLAGVQSEALDTTQSLASPDWKATPRVFLSMDGDYYEVADDMGYKRLGSLQLQIR